MRGSFFVEAGKLGMYVIKKVNLLSITRADSLLGIFFMDDS